MTRNEFVDFLEKFRTEKSIEQTKLLNDIIEEMASEDFFGTEMQSHPLGDMRDRCEYDEEDNECEDFEIPEVTYDDFDNVIDYLIENYNTIEDFENIIYYFDLFMNEG